MYLKKFRWPLFSFVPNYIRPKLIREIGSSSIRARRIGRHWRRQLPSKLIGVVARCCPTTTSWSLDRLGAYSTTRLPWNTTWQRTRGHNLWRVWPICTILPHFAWATGCSFSLIQEQGQSKSITMSTEQYLNAHRNFTPYTTLLWLRQCLKGGLLGCREVAREYSKDKERCVP
jgi:hypothetical protein